VDAGAVNGSLAYKMLASDDSAARGLRVLLPPLELCTDNGAMIAAAGWWQLEHVGPTPLDAGIDPNLRL